MKSGSLNLLEPSGPHRACYGIPRPSRVCSSEMLSSLDWLLITDVSVQPIDPRLEGRLEDDYDSLSPSLLPIHAT
jgi:hypothetical protein